VNIQQRYFVALAQKRCPSPLETSKLDLPRDPNFVGKAGPILDLYQRVLTAKDFSSLQELQQRLFGFQFHNERSASPFNQSRIGKAGSQILKNHRTEST